VTGTWYLVPGALARTEHLEPSTWYRSGVRVRAALLLALLTVACGSRAEETVLRGYFDTCAVADDVALANAALVALDPQRDGVVGAFRVVRVDPEVHQPANAHPAAVHLSLQDPLRRHDESGAVLISETVHLRADVHRGGRATEQTMAVTLARAKTASTVGRWIVVRLVLDGRTLPEVSSGRR
jgi:hypothetical protein